jgi:hypothetical protein
MDAAMSYSTVRVVCTIALTLSLGLLQAASPEDTIGSGVLSRGKTRESTVSQKRRVVSNPSAKESAESEPETYALFAEPRKLRSRTPQRPAEKSYEFGELHRSPVDRSPVRRVNHQEVILEEGDFSDDFSGVSSGGCSGGCSDGSCGGDCDSCGPDGCNSYGLNDWGCPSCIGLLFQRTDFYSGVQSFSGPANRGGAGSFGLHQGLNVGLPVWDQGCGLGMQAGVHFTQSNFNGTDFTDDDRSQVFTTLGLFRRVDWGLQWGVAVDYLHEDWYYQADLTQLRGELSWMMPEGSDIGFMFASSLQDDETTTSLLTNNILNTTTETFESTDLFAFFVRRAYCNGGEARLFAGFSGQSDGLLGGNFSMPLQNNVSCRADLTYLIPEQGKLDGGHVEESWNMGFSVVFNSGCGPCGKNYYRPLFNVANNGSFLVDRR